MLKIIKPQLRKDLAKAEKGKKKTHTQKNQAEYCYSVSHPGLEIVHSVVTGAWS